MEHFQAGLKRMELRFLGGEFEWKIFPGNFPRRKLLLVSLIGALVFREGHGNVSTLVMMTLLV